MLTSLSLSLRFTYSSIQYTAFHGKKFTALVSSPGNGTSHPEQVDFDLESRALAQALYRAITEFHTFFKRDAVSRVVKSAGFCKSLLGNIKGQNPDRFYFDVMRTHHEVIDHVWAILHPSTRFVNGDDTSQDNSRHSVNSPCPSSSSTTSSSNRSNHRQNRNSSHHRSGSSSSSRPSSQQSQHHQSQHQQHQPQQQQSGGTSSSGGNSGAPPLPPPSRHMQRGGSMHRSHSVQDSGLRPPNFTHLPPLPPYSQRSCSSDALIHGNLLRRQHLRTMPSHGPHMASTATFNPYLSPSISETGSDGEEDVYTGGSECYVTMSSCSESTYLPSTQSDPGTTGRAYRPRGVAPNMPLPPQPGSDTSGAPSDLYMTSLDSECSGASYRVNSPPPLYREVDDAHSVPLNFDSVPPTSGNETTPTSAAISFVSPIIPIGSTEPGNSAFDFDAAAVLSRTQELEGELQRLRAAMTCRLCKQDPIGATFCPCGHTVCCYQCAQRMNSCWECNETVTSVQKMLLTR